MRPLLPRDFLQLCKILSMLGFPGLCRLLGSLGAVRPAMVVGGATAFSHRLVQRRGVSHARRYRGGGEAQGRRHLS